MYKFDKLKKSFDRNINIWLDKIDFDKKLAEKSFLIWGKKIAKINFEDAMVEVSNINSLKFTLILSEGKHLYITKYFGMKDIGYQSDNVVISYFVNRKRIISDVVNFEELLTNFEEFLNLKYE